MTVMTVSAWPTALLFTNCFFFVNYHSQGIYRHQEAAGAGGHGATDGAGVPRGQVPVQDGGGGRAGHGIDDPQLELGYVVFAVEDEVEVRIDSFQTRSTCVQYLTIYYLLPGFVG